MSVSNQDVLKVLRSARRLVSNPKKWIKHQSEHLGDDGKVSYCIHGAIEAAAFAGSANRAARSASERAIRARREVVKAIAVYSGGEWDIASYNDRYRTTHKDVYKVLTRAIKEVEAKCGKPMTLPSP
jgi:hypothetical protein